MSVVVLLATGVGALAVAGVARLFLTKRRAAADSEPEPVTPDAADRAVTIVDNGGTPFIVRFSYKRRVATVYLTDEQLDDTSRIFRSFRYRRAFIGLDPREVQEKPIGGRVFAGNPAAAGSTRASPGAAAEAPPRAIWWYGGNTVLLDLGDRRYIFIGLVIYAFTAYDDIHTYVSTMGNSAVPYPFAIGTKNSYCMIEMAYIPNHIIQQHDKEERQDPYSVLYGDELDRWLPGRDPKDPVTSHRGPSSWCESFPLKDYVLLRNRQW